MEYHKITSSKQYWDTLKPRLVGNPALHFFPPNCGEGRNPPEPSVAPPTEGFLFIEKYSKIP
jgi:hypothetical protein